MADLLVSSCMTRHTRNILEESMNISKTREQKSDLRDEKHVVNALVERQGGRQSSHIKTFMEGKLQAKFKRIQKMQSERNISIHTEAGEKGEGDIRTGNGRHMKS